MQGNPVAAEGEDNQEHNLVETLAENQVENQAGNRAGSLFASQVGAGHQVAALVQDVALVPETLMVVQGRLLEDSVDNCPPLSHLQGVDHILDFVENLESMASVCVTY